MNAIRQYINQSKQTNERITKEKNIDLSVKEQSTNVQKNINPIFRAKEEESQQDKS